MLRRVAIVMFPEGQSIDVIGPYEVFAAANQWLLREGKKAQGYELLLVAPDKKPVRMESGILLVPQASLRELRGRLDTLLIAGGRGAREAAKNAELCALVARKAKLARRLASVCTGTFVLAGAGLIGGRRVTTHWAYCDRLQAAFPDLTVERDPIYVHDGRVWTSAGVTAGMDLSLALVERDLGRDVALTLARWLVMFVRRAGGQSQFSAQLSVQSAEREPIRELTSFIVEHPERELPVSALARRAGMSVRNFARVFRAQVGVSPAAYVERVRVESARRLLETTLMSIEQVSEQTGFKNPETLRRAFARCVGLSPREYRARFGTSQGADHEDRVSAVR